MVQAWFDNDGLYRKYGTLKVVPDKGGEYKTYGPLRELEFKIDISTLTTTAAIQSDQVFFPKGVFVEDVVLEVQTAAATITTMSVGMVQSDTRAVAGALTDTNIISALALATITPAGQKITFIPGVTSAGASIGTVPISAAATFTGMFTAKITGSVGTGVVIVRIHYRPVA
jgi:hypothetical protein